MFFRLFRRRPLVAPVLLPRRRFRPRMRRRMF
jgi:hypothetical protein